MSIFFLVNIVFWVLNLAVIKDQRTSFNFNVYSLTIVIHLRLFIYLRIKLFLVLVGGQIAIGTQVLFLSPVTACIFIVFLLNNILRDKFIKLKLNSLLLISSSLQNIRSLLSKLITQL